MWRRASLAFVGVSLTACAAATSYPNPAFVNAGRNVLTAAEIVSARVTDAYQAVIHKRLNSTKGFLALVDGIA